MSSASVGTICPSPLSLTLKVKSHGATGANRLLSRLEVNSEGSTAHSEPFDPPTPHVLGPLKKREIKWMTGPSRGSRCKGTPRGGEGGAWGEQKMRWEFRL